VERLILYARVRSSNSVIRSMRVWSHLIQRIPHSIPDLRSCLGKPNRIGFPHGQTRLNEISDMQTPLENLVLLLTS
jgi:hypothetical protein